MLSLFLALLALATSSGCSTASPTSARDSIANEILAAEAESELDGESGDSPAFRHSRHKIPIEINDKVREWIYYFTVKDRDRFHRFLKRGQTYKAVIQRILKENNVPRELYYLAMIESGFSTGATSHAKAVGIWQFMRGTAKNYGLRADRYIDERRDPIRATYAAAKYLANLHRMFDSWYLAMAGYNAGEGRIYGAVRRGNSRDFWELAEKRVLPRETMEYIPKFLAAVIIGRNPQRFGFHDISPERVYPQTDRLVVGPRTQLRDVARSINVSYSQLKALNPHIRRGVIPAHYRSYPVWVPAGKALAYKAPAKRVLAKASTVRKRQSYRVRKGDTLTSISDRFGVPVSALKKINGLKRGRIYSGQSLKLPTGKI